MIRVVFYLVACRTPAHQTDELKTGLADVSGTQEQDNSGGSRWDGLG